MFIPSQRAIPFWFMLQLVVLDRWFFRLVPLPVQQVRFTASLSDSQINFESSRTRALAVIATSSTAEKQALVAAAGARHSISYVDFPAAVKQITGASHASRASQPVALLIT